MSAERRAHPRMELLAHVEVENTGESAESSVLEAKNISRGGLFLAVAVDECLWLVPGTQVSLDIGPVPADEAGDGDRLICARGRVVRRVMQGSQPGVGIEFESMEDADRDLLHKVLARIR